MVAAQSDSAASQGDLIDAIGDIITDSETLVQARDNADLNELQAAHVDALLDLSQAMRDTGAEDLGPATWIALVRQLESSVSQLITSVNSAQKTPEPRLEQISQAMSGRLSLALQQGFVATALAVAHQAAIRTTLRTDLSKRAPDYSDSDINKALLVALAAAGIAGVLLVIMELSAATTLRRRGNGGRLALIMLTFVHLPIMLITTGLRGGGTVDLWLTAAQAGLLIIAAGAALTPRTRRWLVAKPPLAVETLFGQQRDAGTRADT